MFTGTRLTRSYFSQTCETPGMENTESLVTGVKGGGGVLPSMMCLKHLDTSTTAEGHKGPIVSYFRAGLIRLNRLFIVRTMSRRIKTVIRQSFP